MELNAERRLHIGTLSEEDGEYVFRYSNEFKEQQEVPPISAFPDVGHVYRSTDLWPFFRVRVPSLERQDVREVMQQHGINEADVFELLGVLGRRSISTPYEFVLRDEHRRNSDPLRVATAR